MTTMALKLNQQTIHTIAKATDTPPRVVNEVYENYNLLNKVGYIVIGFTCVHGDEQEPITMDEETFNRDFMFINEPSTAEFSEVIIVR